MLKYLALCFCFCSQLSKAQNMAGSLVASTTNKAISEFLNQPYEVNGNNKGEKAILISPPQQMLDSMLPAYNSSHRLYRDRRIIAPALLISFGFLTLGNPEFLESNEAIQQEITWRYPGFKTHLDDYTQYVPLAAIYGLNLSGVKGKNDILNLSMLYALSSFINNTLTKNIKTLTGSQRPDAPSFDTFPSGHTSTAFANAELMHQEYKHLSGWYSVGGYSFAVATGSLRMLNNRHWLSDVIAGAGVGIFSTRMAYIIYPWLKEKIKLVHLGKEKIVVLPMYQQGSYGLSLGFKVDPKPHKNYITLH